jgi:hypothetical protein
MLNTDKEYICQQCGRDCARERAEYKEKYTPQPRVWEGASTIIEDTDDKYLTRTEICQGSITVGYYYKQLREHKNGVWKKEYTVDCGGHFCSFNGHPAIVNNKKFAFWYDVSGKLTDIKPVKIKHLDKAINAGPYKEQNDN